MLVMLGVPAVLLAAVWLGIAAVRWARRNRARAAAMMTGTYLEDVAGGHIDGQVDDGWWDNFTGWLGDKVDAMSTAHDAGHGDDVGDYSDDAADAGSD